MALSPIVPEIFNVEKYRDLQIRIKGQSRSLKVVPFDILVRFHISVLTLSLWCTVFEIVYSTSKMLWPWKPG